MHQNSAELIKEINLVFGHIFPYSVRDGTVAGAMPQLPMEVRRERGRELRELCKKQLQKFTKEQLKLPHKVLVETETTGRTENYLLIKIPPQENIGTVIEV
jgi:threonylcarbamoyladenosine tRNA methylthiotransferase MtaB